MGVILKRAIQHLYPLEIHENEISDNRDIVSKEVVNDKICAKRPSKPQRVAAIDAIRKIHEMHE